MKVQLLTSALSDSRWMGTRKILQSLQGFPNVLLVRGFDRHVEQQVVEIGVPRLKESTCLPFEEKCSQRLSSGQVKRTRERRTHEFPSILMENSEEANGYTCCG
jgi:hypothetical protein